MAYISYNKAWEGEVDNIVSTEDKVPDLNINQRRLEVHYTYKKFENMATTFEPTDDTDVLNKSCLHVKLKQINSQ